MILDYDDLIDLLMRHAKWSADDASPREAFAIRFRGSLERKYSDTIDYEAVDGRTLVLDVDEHGRVLGLEVH